MAAKSNKKIKVVVLCIIVATTFWFFNAMNNHYTTTVSFPVVYQVTSNQLKLTSDVPKDVEINVYGSGWNILKGSLGLGYEPYRFKLEKEEIKNMKSLSLMPYISHELTKLKVNFIHERTWDIQVDSILRKKIYLEGFIKTNPKKNISLYQPKISPDTIWVTGPRRYLDSLETEMILTIADVTKSGKQSLSVDIKKRLNPNLKSNIEKVKIEFTIDNLIKESKYAVNTDSTERYLFLYKRPESYPKLDNNQLLKTLDGDTLPLYTIYSSVIDTTFHE